VALLFAFSLQPGKVLGVLGRTGSGKTTLACLLLRLYDYQEGEICLGGVAHQQGFSARNAGPVANRHRMIHRRCQNSGKIALILTFVQGKMGT
jgi:ABC-type oligopeptide transport system ATPase subunit